MQLTFGKKQEIWVTRAEGGRRREEELLVDDLQHVCEREYAIWYQDPTLRTKFLRGIIFIDLWL
jgi:hypothetical protein